VTGSASSTVAEAPERLFLAVAVPAGALEACQRLIDTVRTTSLGRDARWVRTENLHLTVRFLGDTPPDVVPDVALATLEAAASAAPFRIELAGAGAFPDGRHPRTIWLGVEEGNDGLIRLNDALEGPLDRLGWAPDPRARRPHLTVARTDAARGEVSHAIADALAAAAAGWRAGFDATALTLFRSHLGGGPPRYEAVVEAPLLG
jgi:RNA 2',3'-cyclic 3'-phosphodiesterase